MIIKKSFLLSPQFLLNPLVGFLLGFFVFQFFPPFFSEIGHKWQIILLDIFSIFILIFGIFCGSLIKFSFFRNRKWILYDKKYFLFLFSVGLTLYSFEIYQFSKEGITVFFKASASKEGWYIGLTPIFQRFFMLLLWYGILIKKKDISKINYFFLILLLLIEFIKELPAIQRGFILEFFLWAVIVKIYEVGLSFKKLVKYFAIFFIILFVSAQLSQVFWNFRTSQGKENFDIKNVELNYEIKIYENFKKLTKRFNHHESWKIYDGYEDVAGDLSLKALKSLKDRFLFKTKTIEFGPGITPDLRRSMGVPAPRSAEALNTSWILFHMKDFGIYALLIFWITFGMLLGVFYQLLNSKKNLFFLTFYLTFFFTFLLLGIRGNSAAVIFFLVRYFIAVFIAVIVFNLIKFFKTLLVKASKNY